MHSFDRGNYLRSPESPRYQSFEDLNYQGEYAWTSQIDRQPLLYNKENVLKKLINTLFTQPPQKTKYTSDTSAPTSSPPNILHGPPGLLRNEKGDAILQQQQDDASNTFFESVKRGQLERGKRGSSSLDLKMNRKNTEKTSDLDENSTLIAEVEQETDKEDEENYSVNKQLFGLEERLNEDIKESEEALLDIDEFADTSFIHEFWTNDPERFSELEKRIKQNYYSNPVYKFLLNINIDSFLLKEPSFQRLTSFEEKKLFEKRLILGSYYDSLRYYNQLPYIEQFQEFFDGSKSYADRVFNQQFKGTLKIVRRLFSITLDPEENINSNRVLKFDQPLFLKKNESQYKPFHEELPQKKFGSLSKATPDQQKSHFLEISNSTPFYAGWDQGLRKLVITNRLLPRSYAGYALYSPTKIKGDQYRTLANFIDSNKKIEFTTWPLPKTILDKTVKSSSTLPYNVLFELIKDLKNQDLIMQLSQIFEDKDTYPVNLGQYSREEEEEEPTEKVFPPNKGGFVWPGNDSLKFDFINTLKNSR